MIWDISDLFFAHPNCSVFHFWLVYAISSRKMLWIHWFDLVLVWLWIQLLLRNEVTLKTSLSSWHAFMGFWEYMVWTMDWHHGLIYGAISFELGFCERIWSELLWETTVNGGMTFRKKSNRSLKLNLYPINFVLWRSNDVTC